MLAGLTDLVAGCRLDSCGGTLVGGKLVRARRVRKHPLAWLCASQAMAPLLAWHPPGRAARALRVRLRERPPAVSQ